MISTVWPTAALDGIRVTTAAVTLKTAIAVLPDASVRASVLVAPADTGTLKTTLANAPGIAPDADEVIVVVVVGGTAVVVAVRITGEPLNVAVIMLAPASLCQLC